MSSPIQGGTDRDIRLIGALDVMADAAGAAIIGLLGTVAADLRADKDVSAPFPGTLSLSHKTQSGSWADFLAAADIACATGALFGEGRRRPEVHLRFSAR